MEEHTDTNNRVLSKIARVISGLFIPYLIPFGVFLTLILFSYLRTLAFQNKLLLIGVIFCFTIAMPLLTVGLFFKINGLGKQNLSVSKRPYIAPLLTGVSYLFCFFMLQRMGIPWFIGGIILAAFLILTVIFIAHLKWRLSVRMAGIGGIIGWWVSFGALFGYNPVGGLYIFISVAGLLGTAEMISSRYTVGGVMCGFTVGLAASMFVLHPTWNTLFRTFIF